MRVIEDAQLPNANTAGTLKAVLNGGDIPIYTQEALLGSLGIRAERLYAFGKNQYLHGLPTAQNFTAARGRTEAAQVLEVLEGAPVLLEYCHFGPPNALHVGWQRLLAEYGYVPATNQLAVLTAQQGTPVYLTDLVLVLPQAQAATLEAGALQQWGIAANAGYAPSRRANTSGSLLATLATPTPIEFSTTQPTEGVRVSVEWEQTTTVLVEGYPVTQTSIQTDQFFLTMTEVDNTQDYFQVKYTVAGVTKYWRYLAGSGGYPALDAVFLAPAPEAGSFFPFAYFRYNKQSENQDTTTEAYRDSKKLVKYLGMDYDVVADAINSNPDIADVEQAMLMLAVPAESTDPIEQRYLYDFFDKLYGMADEQFQSPTQAAIQGLFQGSRDISRHALAIQDARFKMVVSDAGIYKTRKAGSIGSRGSYASAVVLETLTETYQTSNGEEVTTVEQTFTVPHHVYRYQITETLYDEISVVNLAVAYKIWEGHYTLGDDTNDKILLIPLDHSITETYSLPDRERLYARSLHYVFNSRVVTKVKWYQTGIFKVLMIIIAIIVTVITWGSDGGTTLAAAIGATTVVHAIVVNIILGQIIGQLLAVAFKWIVQVFGADLARLAAVVAILYGGYQILEAGSVQGAPWAEELLMVANGLTQAALAADFQDLTQAYSVFQAEMDTQLATLEKAEKLLESNHTLSPFIIFGESPNDFYNRTIHSGNIGINGIDAIGSYVDIALTLPKINDTIGT